MLHLLVRILINFSGVAALALLAACATGPVAGRENALVATPSASTAVSATVGVLPAQAIPTAGAPGGAATYVWQLTNLRLTPAKVIELPTGTLAETYLLVGATTAPTNTLIKEGNFQLVLSAFWPKQDLPGQPAGKWYVKGTWTITDPTVPTPVVRQRQPPGVVTGMLVTTLDHDPTQSGASLTLPITLPLSRVNGVWSKGTGTLHLDPDRGGGSLTLVLERRDR